MPHRVVGQGLAVLVATSVLGVCAPAHADTGDGSTTLSGSLSRGGPAVPEATHKVGERITGRLPSPTPQPTPTPVVEKVTATMPKVTGRARKVTGTPQDLTGPVQAATAQADVPTAPVPSTSAPAAAATSQPPAQQQTSSHRQATPIGSAPRPGLTSVPEHGRGHQPTGAGAAARTRAATAPGQPWHERLLAGSVVAAPSAGVVVGASLVHVPARAVPAVVSPSADPRLPRLADGCHTASLDPDQLRLCATALVLGQTGGLPVQLPVGGVLMLALGATLMRRGRGSRTRRVASA